MPNSDKLRRNAFKTSHDIILRINELLPDHTRNGIGNSEANDLSIYRTGTTFVFINDDVADRQNYRVEVRSFTRQGTITPQFHTVQVAPLNLRECAATVTIPTTAKAGVTRDLLAGLFDLVTTAAALFPNDNDR